MNVNLKKVLFMILTIIGLAIAGIVFLVVFMILTDYRPAEVEALEITGGAERRATTAIKSRELTFMTWNLGYGGLGREMNFFFDRGRMVRAHEQLTMKYQDEIMGSLQAADSVDFFLLQEIDRSSKRTYYHDQWQQLQQGLGAYAAAFAINYDVRYVPLPLHDPYGRVKAGMATLSVVAPGSAARYAFKGNYRWPKNLFMLDRCYIKTTYDLEDGKKLVVINTHNSAFDDGTLKQEQLRVLREAMINEYEKGHYVVVGGDWNMTPPGYRGFNIKTGDGTTDDNPKIDPGYLPGGWRCAFDKQVPSYRKLSGSYIKGRTGTAILDFFMVSPNIELLKVKTGDFGFENSDHNPVVMKIRLK